MPRFFWGVLILSSIVMWVAGPSLAEDAQKPDNDKSTAGKADKPESGGSDKSESNTDKADAGKADKQDQDDDSDGAFLRPDKKQKKDEYFEEVDIFKFVDSEERDKIYDTNVVGSWIYEHNYKITLQAPNESKPMTAIMIERRGGRHGKILSGLRPGALLAMKLDKKSNIFYVKGLARYVLHPGEERPNVFLFADVSSEKDARGIDSTQVKLYKLGRFSTVQVPKLAGKTPDAQMIDAIGKFRKGQSVEVLTRPSGAVPTIKTIDAFAEPCNATFSKLADADVDGGKTPSIEVTIHGKATTILVPGKKDDKGKWLVDGPLAAAVKRYKDGDRGSRPLHQQRR
jgi:hypothetical protein